MTPKPGWWHEERDARGLRTARCALCFHRCAIAMGETGLCSVRGFSEEGEFTSPYLGCFAAVAIDPIEKKPLHYWRPGSEILSLGGRGCNMFCPFCQNHALSRLERDMPIQRITCEQLLGMVKRAGLAAVAYTYHEPTMQAEYILSAAQLLREDGIATVLVSNGMFGTELCAEIAACTDALNIDIKTFDDATYRKMGGSLEVVRYNVEYLAERGVHVELTNLVVPGISDSAADFSRMVDWIAGISKDMPLHISRYFPAHRHTAPPTDVELLREFRALAERRLTRVSLGNV